MPIDIAKLAQYYGSSQNNAPPYHLGTRYDGSGTFLHEPGNTIVCHLVNGSATDHALATARRRFVDMADAGKLALTPVKSYHMTLFQGVNDGRRGFPFWPAELAGDASIAYMTERMGTMLQRLPKLPGFQVEVTGVLPTGLMVDGVTARDRLAMAEWRNTFADIFGYRHPDHDGYAFHITMAYMVDWLDDADLPAWKAMLDAVEADIIDAAPVLELRPPAFCSFEDTTWFQELQVFHPVNLDPIIESAAAP